MPRRYRKQSAAAPPGYFTWEASGLRWLRDAGGAAVVEVFAIAPGHLDLEHLTVAVPSHERAELLGRGLAVTHVAGAPAFGSGPPGWRGNGWLGPLDEPLPLPLGEWPTWGAFLATARIAPLVRRGRDRAVLSRADTAVFDRFTATVADGRYDTGEAPARLHGDLWSGNVLWTPDGAVLIDPAAHGGHREADLAMLALFGCPHLDRLLAAYDEAAPLADGWRDRVLLHQVHPLLLHAVLFGGSYVGQCVAAAAAFR